MRVVLRFFDNPDLSNPNRILSRTLGKVCFVARSHRGLQPQASEFWFCEILAETKAGTVGGCFLAEPWQKVDYEDLVPLSPNLCTVNRVFGATLVVDPVRTETPDGNMIPWILPLRDKAKLLDKQTVAVLINLGGSWWERR